MIKRLIVLILFAIMACMAQAQEPVVNYQAANKSVVRILKELEDKYDFHFAFNQQQLKNIKCTVEANNQPLTQFLSGLLTGNQLSFEILENQFILIKKAESKYLRFHISDQESGEALPFAIAKIKGTHKGFVSDKDGNFEVILREPLGKTLVFSFLGYNDLELAVESLEDDQRIAVEMDVQTQHLNEVVVKEYLNNGITTNDKGLKIDIDPDEMEVLPGLSERDVLLTTQVLAGITSNDETASGLNVRGSSRDRTFIYWNNIPVYQTAHYFGNISSFIPASIGKVSVYKNYVPVNFGGSSAGLILMESKINNTSRPTFESSLNLTHADVYANFPIMKNKGSLMLSARRSYNNLLATPTFTAISDKLFEGTITQDLQQELSDGEFQYNSKLVFTDFNLQWNYEPTNKDQLTVSALRSGSVLDYSTSDEEEINASTQTHEVTNSGISVEWNRRWNRQFKSDVTAAYANYQMEYSLINEREEDEADDDNESRLNELNNLEVRLTNQYQFSENTNLRFGYQLNSINVLLQINEAQFFEEDSDELIDSQGLTHGLFSEYEMKTDNGITWSGGLRANYYATTETLVVDPLLKVNYALNKNFTFKAAFGRVHQYLSALTESEFSFSNTVEQQWLVADEEESVPLISNRQLVAGFLWEQNNWLIDLDVYQKNIDGLFARNLGPGFDDEDGFEIGSERILGIDFTVRKKWRNYKAWLSYAFQDSHVEVESLGLSGLSSALNLRHQLQLSQTLNFRQFEFSLGATLRSGIPFTRASGITFVDEPEDGEEVDFDPFYRIDYETLNANRLRSYFRLDASIWYKFPKKTDGKFNGEVGFSVLNLLDNDNFYNRTYTIDELEDDRVVLFSSEKRLLGITPNLSVRVRF
ncbi:MAG: carboxypeptidase-like regulatory domain-containing protein [Bacteroidota bacterium]